jgi:N-methylhydantoinase A
MEKVYGELERQGREAIAGTSAKPRAVVVKRAADMRYVGQEHAVTVDLPLRLFVREDRAGIKRAFDAMHAQRYGTSAPDEPAEIVSLRSTVTGALSKPKLNTIKRGKPAPERAAMRGKRPVYFDGRFRMTDIYDRALLLTGNRIDGPALIEEYASTTVLWPRDRLRVDPYGSLHISVAGAR